MKKKTIVILLVVLIVLCLVNAGAFGYIWYRDSHVFLEGDTYSRKTEEIDLRGRDVSFEYYDILHAELPDCRILWDVPFRGQRLPNDTRSLPVTEAFSDYEIVLLREYFPELQELDVSGCRDYAMLEQLHNALPELTMDYGIDLGGITVPRDTRELTLENGSYTLEALNTNLPFLHVLERVLLKMPQLTQEEIAGLQEVCPNVEFRFTVDVFGIECDETTQELDLSALTGDQLEAVCEKLQLLPSLRRVELMAADGTSALSKQEAAVLLKTLPDVEFSYSFDFYGEKLSTATKEVNLRYKRIGNAGEPEIRAALDLMPHCERFVLDSCQVSNEVMASIREDYRGRTKVVWRIQFAKGSCLTDVEVIRTTYDLVDSNAHDLMYCEDVRYMDIGHDEFLDSIDFVAYMPNLEVIIISGSPVKDLTPFTNCKKLRVLEAAFCEYLTDASPLAQCESLQMLNISYTHITDLSPLDELKLTHMIAKYYPRSRVPEEEQQRFAAQHPDCLTQYVGDQPYGAGWRYTDDNKPLDWYADITHVFRYPDAPNNAGWYLD